MDLKSKTTNWVKKLKNNEDTDKLLPEIEKYAKKYGNKTNKYAFQELLKVVDLTNYKTFAEISHFLVGTDCESRNTFYFPLLVNLLLKNSKEKNFNFAVKLINCFYLENLACDEDISKTLSLLHQTVTFCVSNNYLNVPEIAYIFKHLANAIPFIVKSQKAVHEVIERFLGRKQILTILNQIQCSSSLNSFLAKLFTQEFDAREKKGTQELIIKNLSSIFKISRSHQKDFDCFSIIWKRIHSICDISFLLSYEKLINQFKEGEKHLAEEILKEFEGSVQEAKNRLTQADIEISLIITSTIRETLLEKLKNTATTKTTLIILKIFQILINLVKNHQGNEGIVLCNSCQDLKRHAVLLIVDVGAELVITLAKKNIEIDKNILKTISFMFDYAIQTIERSQCASKETKRTNVLIHIWNFVCRYKVYDNPSFKSETKLLQIFLDNASSAQKIFNPSQTLVFFEMSYKHSDPIKSLDAEIMRCLPPNKIEGVMRKIESIVNARKGIPKFTNLSIASLAIRSDFNNFGLKIDPIDVPELILVEMEYNFRYLNLCTANLELFKELVKNTDDVQHLTQGLYLFEIEEHKQVDQSVKEHIEKNLEKIKKKNVQNYLGLALIYFRQYLHMHDQAQEDFKELKTKFDDHGYATDFTVLEKYSITAEEPMLKTLRKSYENFKMALETKDDAGSRFSYTKIIKMLEYIAAHYRMRNFEYEATEAQILALKYAQKSTNGAEWPLLQCYAFLIENVKQFLQFPGEISIMDVVNQTYELVKKLLQNFNEIGSYRQSLLLSSLLHLAQYYLDMGDIKHCCELVIRVRKYDKILQEQNLVNIPKFRTLRIKCYYLQFQLIQMNPQKRKGIFYFFSMIMYEFSKVVEIQSEFLVHLPTILFKSILKFGFEALKWQDVALVEPYLLMMYKHAMKYGLSMRMVQLMCLKAQIDLIKPNPTESESKLQCLDVLCKFESPNFTQITSAGGDCKTPAPRKCIPSKINLDFQTPDIEIMSRDASVMYSQSSQSSFNKTLTQTQRTPPGAISDLKKYLIHDDFESSNPPQLVLYAYVIGCSYARFLFKNKDYLTVIGFYERARMFWPQLNDQMLRSKVPGLVDEFHFYSRIFHYQHILCLLAMNRTGEAQILSENGLEQLDMDKNDRNSCKIWHKLEFEKVKSSKKSVKKALPFNQFDKMIQKEKIKTNYETPKLRPKEISRTVPRKTPIKNQFPVYVDSPKKVISVRDRRLAYSNKKAQTALEGSSIETIAMQAPKTVEKRVTKATLTKSSTSVGVKSTSKTVKPATIPSHVNKKQLKFSPTLNSPDVVVIKDSEDENDSPNPKPAKITKTPRTQRAPPPTPKSESTPKPRESVVNTSMETPVLASYSARRMIRTRKATAEAAAAATKRITKR